MSEHPTYPCSTIIEALCEFRMELSPDNPWNPTLPGAVFDRLKEKFPQFEPVAEFGVEMSVGPQGPVQRIIQAPAKYKMSNAQGDRLIQLSSSVCVFNVLKPYTSWSHMKGMIDHWPVIRDVIAPAAIIQVGLRYINKIPVPDDHRIGDWLQSTKYLSQGVVDSLPPMAARIEATPDVEHRLLITVTDTDTESPSIIYDIDCIRLGRIAGDPAEIDNEIEELHTRIWDEFSSAKTSNLEKLLNGESKP